jgi:glycogen operon protein
MIAFRKQHPSLARSRFWREDIRWFGPRGVVDYASPAVAWCLRGATRADRDLYVLVNSGSQPVTFELQDTAHPWRLVVDTSRPSPGDIELDRPAMLERPSYVAASHSVVVLVGE